MIFDDEGKLDPEEFDKLRLLYNRPENPVTFLAVDPGKSTGVAGYDEKYYLQFMYTVKEQDMVKFLNVFEHVSLIVMESYRVFTHKLKAHANSDLVTSRVIGRVEAYAENKGATLITQSSDIKTTGYKWIQRKPYPKSDPRNHSLDAHVHFMYFAVRRGFISLDSLVKRTVK